MSSIQLLNIAIKRDDLNDIKQLLKSHVNINKQNDYGYTPLHFAIWSKSSLEIVQLLLTHNADPNIQNSNGNTPLHNAITRKSSLAIIELLLNHKADINIQDYGGRTPLDLAINEGNYEFVEFLHSYNKKRFLLPCIGIKLQSPYMGDNV